MRTGSLFKSLSAIVSLPDELISNLEKVTNKETFKARQIIHAAGQLENRLFYLESGFVRSYYYDHHGNEHTVRFWEPGDTIFSYEGYYNVPSYFYTDVHEESKLVTISYRNLHELDSKFPEIAVIIKHTLLRYQQDEHEKQKLIDLPAEERYFMLLKNRPTLFKKLPTRIIASYLHMSRETLTRFIGRR